MYLKGSRTKIGSHDAVIIQQLKQDKFAREQMSKEKKAPPPKKKGRPPVDANGKPIEELDIVARTIDKKRVGQVICIEGWAVTVKWPNGDAIGYPSHWLVVQKNGKK